MNHTQQTCDAERLEAYLHGRLDEQQEHEIESHIDSCESCRYRMEQYAAEPASWEEATALLGDPRWRNEAYQTAPSNHRSNPNHNNHRLIQCVIESLAPTDDPAMLGRMDGYEISGVIGCGGMGAVLKGFDRSLNRVVAIKVMAPHLASSGAARLRFAREAQAAAAMTHDNVIDIYGVSEANGLPYLVMPYARGQSLQKRLDDRGPLPVVEILRIGSQIAAGLAAAHSQGLVHRDIKPANILLNDGVERLVITDFGLARAVDDASVTRTGVIAGTPQYMSPEQARGETVDCRSDLFSLGSVMYTVCVGRPPFRAESAYGILRRITDNDPRPIRETNPDIPDWLCRIIDKLMAKRPDERFDSAEEVAELLEDCLAHVQQPTTAMLPARISKPQPKAGSQLPPRFRRVAMGVLGGFLCVLAGIVIVLELNKGTLTIESAEAGIPIRILQGEEVCKEMTVTTGNNTVRIAAGQYVVEIEGQHDGLQVANDGVVTVTRGEKQLVKITSRDGGTPSTAQNQSLAARQLVSQLRNMQLRRAKLLETHGTRHPEVLKLDSEIKAMDRLIARADSEVTKTTGSVTIEVPKDVPEVVILRGRKQDVEIVEKSIRSLVRVPGTVGSAKEGAERRLEICEASELSADEAAALANSDDNHELLYLHSADGQIIPLRRKPETLLNESDLVSAVAKTDPDIEGAYSIDLYLQPEAAERFAQETKRLSLQLPTVRLAILASGKLHSAPRLVSEILDGKMRITGRFTKQEAEQFAAVLSRSTDSSVLRER